jgi:6-phosphogluconolactonase
MHLNPKKFLHGLLYTTPVLLLVLASCGGGGGGGNTPPPLASTYTVGGTISGLTNSSGGLVLRNNGGDDLVVASGAVASYTFSTALAAGASYKVTVLTNPSSPTQACTVANASGAIASANVANVNVSCVTAYTIGGTISGDPTIAVSGIGPILQNNGGDNLSIPILPASGVSASFTFNIPLVTKTAFNVTQLLRARSPGQNCDGNSGSVITGTSGVVGTTIVTMTIKCVAASIVPRFAFVTNGTGNTVSPYTIAASGVLAAGTAVSTGTGPSSVSVYPGGRYAYVANQGSNDVSAYSIGQTSSNSGALTVVQASVATGTGPVSVTVHPSGKFAYVVNKGSNDISVYSIDSLTGALSAVDANGALTGTQKTIAAGTTPSAVTIDPAGNFAYVANSGSGNITFYTIDQISGALTYVSSYPTAISAPSSIAIDPTGKFAVVTTMKTTTGTVDSVVLYTIDPAGALAAAGAPVAAAAGSAPRSVAIDPSSGLYAYVANAGTNNVSLYTINPVVGTITAGASYLAGTTPVSVNVDPSGAYVYVANSGGGVTTFSIGTGGALILVGTATATGAGPTSVTTTQ